MSTAKSILGIVPGLQATALVGENLKLFKPAKKTKLKGKKMPKNDFMKTGVKNIVGIGLIGASSSMINTLD